MCLIQALGHILIHMLSGNPIPYPFFLTFPGMMKLLLCATAYKKTYIRQCQVGQKLQTIST